MEKNDLEDMETELLLEAIYKRYGHDFRDYSVASITRRIRHAQKKYGYSTISDMIPGVLHDESFFEMLLADFSITVTRMFRYPPAYRALREKVIPVLRTYPFFKVWHAGCATGEEVYSLAILLEEEGLYERCTIFATDFNDNALEQARTGIYPLDNIKDYTANYQRSGGLESFSKYYHAEYGNMIINNRLKRNVTFANHNLVTASAEEPPQRLCPAFCVQVPPREVEPGLGKTIALAGGQGPLEFLSRGDVSSKNAGRQ